MHGSELLRDLRHGAYYAFRAAVLENPLCRTRVQKLLRNETMPVEWLRQRQLDQLYRTLRTAVRKIPFYRGIKIDFGPEEAGYALAERFPIITKYDLLTRRALFYPHGGRQYPWTIIGRTSGASGTPLAVFRSIDSIIWETAFIRRHWSWAGFHSGMRRATLRGEMVVPLDQTEPPFWYYNRYNNQLLLSSRHLRGRSMEPIISKLSEFSPFLLQAYPSTAYELAFYLRETGRHLSIPYIYTASEVLHSFQRELIQERLCGRVVDLYGMAERAAFAGECEYGGLHVNTDYSWVEIVDEQGRPTEGLGYLVGTTFYNHAMPLVRYRIDDQATWKRAACGCGRPYPLIERVEGRAGDALFGSDGKQVSPGVLTFVFKDLEHIRCAQVAQVGAGVWEIRVVPLASFNEDARRNIIENVRKRVDPNIKVRVVEVEDIPRTAAGKYQWIVNEAPGRSTAVKERVVQTELP